MPKVKIWLVMTSEYRKGKRKAGEKHSHILFSLACFHFLFPPVKVPQHKNGTRSTWMTLQMAHVPVSSPAQLKQQTQSICYVVIRSKPALTNKTEGRKYRLLQCWTSSPGPRHFHAHQQLQFALEIGVSSSQDCVCPTPRGTEDDCLRQQGTKTPNAVMCIPIGEEL